MPLGWRGLVDRVDSSSRFWRRFPPTREGWIFLMATLVVGLVAMTAGLNLLFLVWGMMLFLVLASGAMSEVALRGLSVRRSVPQAIHAGTPYLVGVALTNGKRRLPSFSIEVEDLMDGAAVDKRCFFLKVPAGRTQETAYRHVVTRRGRHRLSGFRIATRFPFGFINKSRTVRLESDLLVYPALVPVPAELVSGLASRHGRGAHKWRSRRGEFFGLREFRQGDDPRDIHWRTSARRGRPFVRETEDDEGLEVCIVVDNQIGNDAGNDADPSPGGPRRPTANAAFEAMVSMAASLAVELIRRRYRVGLITRGEEIPPESGAGQSLRILRHLALIAPADGAVPLPDTVARTGASIWLEPDAPPALRFGRAELVDSRATMT
jgi:uncharacterized protein (DUF58 family)